jgi:hypothetical protein
VLERAQALGAGLRAGLEALSSPRVDGAAIEALWQAEGLGTLLWALELATLPPYDRTFEPRGLLTADTARGRLRDRSEIEHAAESARLWHWRARTARLRAQESLELPAGWQSFEQLIAVAALRGHERGLLPAPLRGDFPAFGTGYRALPPPQLAEAASIAYERHRALSWLCGLGPSWEAVPTDT